MDVVKKTLEYEELFELPVSSMDITYGPVKSRRLGRSLGINLLGSGEKICSFNCPYCELGFTHLTMSQIKKFTAYPTLADIEAKIRQHILKLSKDTTTKETQTFDNITISGNGEPTLYPDFLEVATSIKKIRDDLCPGIKINILSNGSTLDQPRVVKGLNILDERMIKLDAGNDAMLKKIGSPLVRLTTAKLIQGAKNLTDVILQCLFLQGEIDNTLPAEVEDWVELVGIVKPKAVHIYSLDRVPPRSGLKQVSAQRLKEIALNLQKRTSIKATVFS
jgi:wyosine [tRNA(Phe)-imidazoG37] synthetase (radical SAM superfamily)